jgi:F-box/TPR repeat protein Pof3
MLTHAVVKNLSARSIDRVLLFFSRCPRLEYLEIWMPFGCQAFHDLFKGSKRMKTLKISAEMTVPQEYIAKFLTSLPLLERIEIFKAKSSLASNVQWPSKLPHLRSITLGTTEGSFPGGHTPPLYIPRQEVLKPLYDLLANFDC